MITCLNAKHGRAWSMYHGDSVEIVAQLPDRSVDLMIYSPPFSDLFVYSESERDMGNNDDDGFQRHYGCLVPELLRVLRPGRMCVVHVADLPSFKFKHGVMGLRDFSGEVIRTHQAAGFIYHTRVTVWKDPVTEMQRTKAHGLLYKNILTDSTRNRVGNPDYLLAFRREPETPEDEAAMVAVKQTREGFPLDQWQQWASPVWMDVDYSDTLNVRAAREDSDEKHMCPLSLDIIRRVCGLYSNPGEVVLSPFGGVGSEGVGALRLGRKYVGIELKESYFNRAASNLTDEEQAEQIDLFGGTGK